MDKPGLITGCGPIGMLAILVARQAGVLEVLVTDITSLTLDMAKTIGADQALNVAADPAALDVFSAQKRPL